MSRNLRYSEDELRDQWAFIDRLVDSQAAALRSGVQDPDEERAELVPDSDVLRELDDLRQRVRQLEDERDRLLERLRIAEAAPVPARGAAVQPAPRRVEARFRDWWRRLNR